MILLSSVQNAAADWFHRQARRLGRMPAGQIIWVLAAVPLILPAPALSLIMSVRSMVRDSDRSWLLPAGVALINLVGSAVLIGWLSHLYAGLVMDRILDLLDLLPTMKPRPDTSISV